ncbi:MAG: radical SAM protein [Bacillota bacterium]
MSKYRGYENVLQEQLKDLIASDKPIILFGVKMAGLIGKKTLDFLGKKVVCFCDNDKAKQGTVVDRLEVLSPKQGKEKYPDAKVYICLLNNDNIKQVKVQLEGLGFNDIFNKDVLFYVYQIQVIKRPVTSSDLADTMDVLNNNEGKLIMSDVVLFITEQCTLNCKECSALVPYIKKPINYPKNIIIEGIQRLSQSVDAVMTINILGGEPLLHQDIVEICAEVSKLKNVLLVRVVTNGTILPDNDILSKLKTIGTCIHISDYGELSINKGKLIEVLAAHKMIYELAGERALWYPVSPPQKSGRSYEENITFFSNCEWSRKCPELQNGELHICGYSASGTALGVIPSRDGDYVNVLDPSLSTNEIRQKIDKLLNHTNCITACDYCGFDFTRTTVRAAQANGKLDLQSEE